MNKYTIDQTHLLSTPGFTRTVYTRGPDGGWSAAVYAEGRKARHFQVEADTVTKHLCMAYRADFVCQVHTE